MPRAATRPLPRAERRQTIVEGAARAFAAAGFDGTTMEAIAQQAGVTKLILYRHFESKEELYRTVLEEVSGELAHDVATARQQGNGPPGHSRHVIVPAFLAVARRHPDGFRLLWRHAAHEPRFAAYAEDVRTVSVAFAARLLEPRVDPALLDWAAPTAVAFLVEALLTWLDTGDPAEDGRFADLTSRSLVALVDTWAG